MSDKTFVAAAVFFCLLVSPVFSQGFGFPGQWSGPDNQGSFVSRAQNNYQSSVTNRSHDQGDIMDTRNFRLIEYRRMFAEGRTPHASELVGYWRGVNKGIVELFGYKQFIKEILPNGSSISGDNLKVGQVNNDLLRSMGWRPVIDPETGSPERTNKFGIRGPDGRGAFGHGAIFSYREGSNRPADPVNLLVDKVVMVGPNHVLGRATANFGPVHIPLAYFMLERM